MGRFRRRWVSAGAALTLVATVALPGVVTGAVARPARASCDDNGPVCAEIADPLNYEGQYTGHDEPSLLFYSDTAGSGNSNVYSLTLPKDPPVAPRQDGSGGTFNFQLHPAFWFGMAMCDSQSYPEYTDKCTPNSDSNVFDNADPTAPDYIGHHPGAAFMEMQFYPPGWVTWPAGNSCDATKWCAALNIDSLSQSLTSTNNAACQNAAGVEYVNFAFITKSGAAQAPADPTTIFQPPYTAITPDPSADLFMSSGDKLTVDMHDTAAGFQVVIRDLTSRQTGSMTASVPNGFAQVKFDPAATTCTSIPQAFHPMYATSSEHTRVPWAAHSYNVSFADEIGHFEYCNAADPNTGACTSAGATDPGGVDGDDYGCFNPADSSFIPIGGCLSTDTDFDGPEYSANWPGSSSNLLRDVLLNPRPITFSSPQFKSAGDGRGLRDYSRVAFEADLPRIEAADFGGPCNRATGVGCVNPPPGAAFYPIFTTTLRATGCQWQLGGSHILGTLKTFGGTSTAEYGPLLLSTYASGNAAGYTQRYNNFRQILPTNPCRSGG
jgi:hypothetical protein